MSKRAYRPLVRGGLSGLAFPLAHGILTTAPTRRFGLERLWLGHRLDRIERVLVAFGVER
jgi:hypothetical protein